MPDELSPSAAAARIGATTRSVQRWIAKGRLPARRVGNILRRLVREQMTLNAQMNALANETLNVSGALLVKLFGRVDAETARYGARAAAVRDVGIRQSVWPAKLAAFSAATHVQTVSVTLQDPSASAHCAQLDASPSASAAQAADAAAVG